MVARCSRDSWEDAGGVAAQAQAIVDRAVVLAQADAKVWEEALSALHDAQGDDSADAKRDFQLERKLEEAAAVPLEIAELGADAAALAALAGERGDGTYRADASAAAALAAGGARAAAHLVQVNLAVRPGDTRLVRARASEQAASEAADRLLAPIR
jgi:formiminotetrahydrofolate cyclodeaminase